MTFPKVTVAVLVVAAGVSVGCLPYLYHEREPALVKGVDIDQTLKVADDELKKDDGFSVLTIWAIRDQYVDEAQAAEISKLYFEHVNSIDNDETRHRKFGVWHLTWAVSNLYRFGDEKVKAALQSAYDDATKRIKTVDRSFAEKQVLGDEMYTGFAHIGGVAYARNHLVVPGNDEYLQSYGEYARKNGCPRR